jgi:hypothetical protein
MKVDETTLAGIESEYHSSNTNGFCQLETVVLLAKQQTDVFKGDKLHQKYLFFVNENSAGVSAVLKECTELHADERKRLWHGFLSYKKEATPPSHYAINFNPKLAEFPSSDLCLVMAKAVELPLNLFNIDHQTKTLYLMGNSYDIGSVGLRTRGAILKKISGSFNAILSGVHVHPTTYIHIAASVITEIETQLTDKLISLGKSVEAKETRK